MPEQFALAQGSILIDIPPGYCPAYSALSSAERDVAGTYFRLAIAGGGDPVPEELFADIHQSTLRQVVKSDENNQVETSALATTANSVIAAYNAQSAEFGLTFNAVGADDPPSCYRWVWDTELEQWVLIVNFGLSVATGDATAAGFNWLPIEDARKQKDFALPSELSFLLNGDQIVVDLRYHLTLTFIAR